MKILMTAALLLLGGAALAQPFTSPYLQEPDRAIGYVDSCAAFWLHAHDPNPPGGFYTNIDRFGNVITAWGTNKNMITQSRDAYGFVRAYMLTGNDLYLQMAREALDFMYAHAWDAAHGGWYGDISRSGNPIHPTADKSAFDQHYALLGIAAYVEATGDSLDWNWLLQGYDHLENNLWDGRPAYEGYYDFGRYDWATVQNKSFNATVDAITTHLLSLYLMTEEQIYLTRLQQLSDNTLDYLVASMPSQAIGFVERYDSDWNWNNNETMTIMGHVLKAAWCLGRVHRLAPDNAYIGGADLLIDDVWNNGYDHQLGGPYKDYNRITGEMLMWGNPDTAKAWWQMEQAVTAGLEWYDITGDPRYLQMADETLDFFMRFFVDHVYGEVYENRTRYGAQTWGDHKGNGAKAGYHSIELGYYVYLYGKLLLHGDSAALHYKFQSQPQARDVRLTPLAVSSGALRISQVLLEGQLYSDYDPDNRTLHLPSGIGGHFEVTYQPVSTGLASGSPHQLPGEFVLEQNYPNPFNPSTTIAFTLPRASRITLQVFDLLGRRVRTLINGNLAAGTHTVTWDGHDQSGRPAASGMYFYELSAGTLRQAKRMILLR